MLLCLDCITPELYITGIFQFVGYVKGLLFPVKEKDSIDQLDIGNVRQNKQIFISPFKLKSTGEMIVVAQQKI